MNRMDLFLDYFATFVPIINTAEPAYASDMKDSFWRKQTKPRKKERKKVRELAFLEVF